MALTYVESYQLMADPEFRGRIKVAALHYANYILDEPTDVPAHSSREKWALTSYQQPDTTANNLQPAVVMVDTVQGSGATISDSDLQTAVEKVINRLL